MCMCCTGRPVSRQANSPCSMRVLWNGKPHKVPGFSQSQTHQFTALLPPCPLSLFPSLSFCPRSPVSVDRIKWVILQSEGSEFLYKLWLWQHRHAEKVFTVSIYWLLSPRGKKKRKRYCLMATCDLLGCLLICPCYCCMFGLLSDWLKWLFLLDCLRVPLQPDNSSQSVPYLNSLHLFTTGLLGLQAAYVPVS